jgi:hypothetical protein
MQFAELKVFLIEVLSNVTFQNHYVKNPGFDIRLKEDDEFKENGKS